MSGLNRYYRSSHIAEKKFPLLVRYFAMDLSASQTAVLSGISRRTTNSIFLKIRVRLFAACQAASPFSSSEVDESYFGARRVRGKRGRGAFGGVSKETSHLHLKECQWRFNNRSKNLYLELLNVIKRKSSLNFPRPNFKYRIFAFEKNITTINN